MLKISRILLGSMFKTNRGRHHYNGPAVYLEYDIEESDSGNKDCVIVLLKINNQEHRGRGLGQFFLKHFIKEMFADPEMTEISLQAFPQEVDGKKSTLEQLSNFYGSLGFVTDKMVLKRA
jgi:hypothetical protein